MKGPLGVIAGRGVLPIILIERLAAAGHGVVVAAIARQAPPLDRGPAATVTSFPLGAIGAAAAHFRSNGVSTAFMAGGIGPGAWRSLRPDRSALSILPLALLRGDDAVLRAVARAFARKGVEIADPAPWISDLLAKEGPLAGPGLAASVLAEMRLAVSAAADLGARDVGQAVVSYKGRIVAREGKAGTTALLASAPGPGAVLVKIAKPTQDRRFDRPVVGPSTVLAGARVGLCAIGVEAGEVLLIERRRTLDLCDRLGVALYGLPPTRACDNMRNGRMVQ